MSVGTYAAAQLLRLLPRTGLSHAVGRLCEKPLPPVVSRAVMGTYIRAYDVDMRDVAGDAGHFRSFNAFFTRPLRPGARVVSADGVVSPADGRLTESGVIDPTSSIAVKGQTYDVAELVGDKARAAELAGGAFAVVYLSPRDYHRVHSPVDGNIRLVRGISGDLYPVNSIGEKHVPNLFVKNQRVAVTIDTKDHGPAVVVLVGAMIVGRIAITAVPSPDTPLGIHSIEPPRTVRRGDEIGAFLLGSTVVVLMDKSVTFSRRRGPIRYGESLLSP